MNDERLVMQVVAQSFSPCKTEVYTLAINTRGSVGSIWILRKFGNVFFFFDGLMVIRNNTTIKTQVEKLIVPLKN